MKFPRTEVKSQIGLRSLRASCKRALRIRGKCDWYKYGEKSTKFFLNLEKTRAHQNKIRNILINGNEITDQKEVNNELFTFYNNLFKNDKRSSKYDTKYLVLLRSSLLSVNS